MKSSFAVVAKIKSNSNPYLPRNIPNPGSLTSACLNQNNDEFWTNLVCERQNVTCFSPNLFQTPEGYIYRRTELNLKKKIKFKI